MTLHREIVRCFALDSSGMWKCESVYHACESPLYGLALFMEAYAYKEVKHIVRIRENGVPILISYRDLFRYGPRKYTPKAPMNDA